MPASALSCVLPDVDALTALVNPERVTVAGDFHGQDGWAAHVMEAAATAGSTVLVQVGDFGLWSHHPGQVFLDRLTAEARLTGIPVVFIDGNHEDFELLATFPLDPGTGLRVVTPWVFHAPRGHRWVWRSLTWLALGGATSLNRAQLTPGLDWFPQEALTTADAYRAVDGGRADVMITHDVPAGAVVPGVRPGGWPESDLRSASSHRELLRRVVDEVTPTHLFHGHFHTRYTADLRLAGGLTCTVEGLGCDGSGQDGYVHLDLDVLVAQSTAARI